MDEPTSEIYMSRDVGEEVDGMNVWNVSIASMVSLTPCTFSNEYFLSVRETTEKSDMRWFRHQDRFRQTSVNVNYLEMSTTLTCGSCG